MKPWFISIEGIDGIGKTTLIANLINHYKGPNLFVTKEPGDASYGSKVGFGVRQLLFKEPTANDMAPGVADLLFLADHVQNSFEISEKLSAGFNVISDRYADSQFAYAASSTKQAPEWAMSLYETHYGTKPTVIVLLVAEFVESGWTLCRAKSRRGTESNKQEGKPWNYIEEQILIQNSYKERLSKQSNVVFVPVNTIDDPEDITRKVVTSVTPYLLRYNGKSS